MDMPSEEVENKKMSLAENILNALKNKGMRVTELAIRSRVPLSTISQITHGNIPNPRVKSVVALAKALDVSVESLVLGKDGEAKENARQAIINNDGCSNAFNDYVPIRLSTFKVDTGWNEDKDATSIYIPRKALESEGITPKNCRAFKFQGGSMSPRIENNSIVLIDCSAVALNQIIDDGIYAFIESNSFKIKKLRTIPDGVNVISEAEGYDVYKIEKQKFQNEFRLIGKVIYSLTHF